ncbi:SMC family ATPase [Halobacillus salinarum]|uniref:Nuclease SbcCD subunit C n=1 Tax=Halobacillus salinarum TaxID=2932257 RepID=A0ABY4EE91_9BACI|nr:SMC family ATPase [Halobacillus salinarum]UOQ42780.1 SMC family ATPase [Halobacillus salinarum]
MKAHTLEMNAFGPYKSKQKIDFSYLGDEPIFLITGPTGAGKTTIFDAMSFALYGKASGSDRDQDSLRSHFADAADVTAVEFCFQLRGKDYKVVRMPKQLKPKERGDGYKEEPARAELYMIQAEGDKLLASKIKDVNDTIEELLGLDYEQFRKMIMIPQGEFRRLISENSKEREEILQRIFRTHFYAEITDYLKNQSKKLQKEIEEFQWKMEQEIHKIHWQNEQMEDENPLPEFVLETLEKELAAQESSKDAANNLLKQLQKQNEEAQNQYYQAEKMLDWFKELEQLKQEKQQLEEEDASIKQLKARVEKAEKSAEVAPYELQWQDRLKEYEKAKQEQDRREKHREQKEVKHKEVHAYYLRQEEKEQERSSLKEKCTQKTEERRKLKEFIELKKDYETAKNREAQQEKKLAAFDKQLGELQTRKTRLQEKRASYSNMGEKKLQKEYELERLEKRLKDVRRLSSEWNKLVGLRQKYQTFYKEFQEVNKRFEADKSNYEQALDDLKQHHAYTLALQTKEGSACPVCGSTHHPALAQRPNSVVTTNELDRLKREFKLSEEQYENYRKKAVDVKAEGESQRQLTDSLYNDLSTIIPELTESAINYGKEATVTAINTVKKEVDILTAKVKEQEEAASQLEACEKKGEEIQQSLNEAKEQYYALKQTSTKLQTTMDNTLDQFEFETLDIEELDKSIDSLKTSYESQMQEYEKAKEAYQLIRDEVYQLQAAEKEGELFVEKLSKASIQQQKKFKQMLEQYCFASMEDYKAAVLSTERITEYRDIVTKHRERKAVVDHSVQQLEKKLASEKRPDLQEMKLELEAVKQKVYKQQELLNNLEMEWKTNLRIKELLGELLEAQGSLSRKYYDLAELAQLAKGENPLRLSLERYVLAAFLDEILIQANLRFDQMSDHRYQLLRSQEIAKRGAQSGLDLEVLDHHTGQKRSVRTLSGGEGFKASLSLALGMSDVVQAHSGGVQLDTLFIDEGFGSLDEISLEQAIDCLRGLQEGNRLLGIISHVPQLKEEIPAKLQIQTGPQGSSVEFVFQ